MGMLLVVLTHEESLVSDLLSVLRMLSIGTLLIALTRGESPASDLVRLHGSHSCNSHVWPQYGIEYSTPTILCRAPCVPAAGRF